jgi:hypothetical protein
VKPQFGASLTDNSRIIIYDCNMFIIQATNESQTWCHWGGRLSGPEWYQPGQAKSTIVPPCHHATITNVMIFILYCACPACRWKYTHMYICLYVCMHACMYVVCLRMFVFVLYYYNKLQSLVTIPSIYKHYYQLKAERQLKKHETTWSHFYQKYYMWRHLFEPHKWIF